MINCFHDIFIKNDELIYSNEFGNQELHLGTSIYEVIRIIDGKPLFLNEHLNRLYNSAQMIGFPIWMTASEIEKQMQILAIENKVQNGNIEVIFKLERAQKDFLCLFIEDRYPVKKMYKEGVPSQLFYAERENPPNAKKINLPFREATNREIQSKELYELILVDKNGFITEGSRSNIFFIKNNKVTTTPVTDVLAGITREKIIYLCKKNNIPIIERQIKADEISNFDSAFFTGTSPKVLAISNIGDINFNTDTPLLNKITELYDSLIVQSLKNL